MSALLLLTSLLSAAEPQLWTSDATTAEERPSLLSPSLDATRDLEPIPDVATPAAAVTSATFAGALPLGSALSLATEVTRPDGDGPALAPSALVGAAFARAFGAARLQALVGRVLDPGAEAAVLELGAALDGPLQPALAVRRTMGAGATTETNVTVAAPLGERLELGVSARSVAADGSFEAGALVLLALR